jgi:6-pyruvoyl-tetrahydropterin synthase
MQIPVKQILKKMQLEIQEAILVDDEAKIRDRLLIVESLCKLILDNESQMVVNRVRDLDPMVSIKKQPSVKEKENENDANGESLFDF